MNTSNIIFLDFETGSANPNTCQVLQISSIAINGRRLEVFENSLFNSYVRPIIDLEECNGKELDPISDKALKVNKIDLEKIKDSPDISTVWNQFVTYVDKYKKGQSLFSKPIMCGFNNNRFDDIIVSRLVKQYGPYDNVENEPLLFNRRDNIDLMKIIWLFRENMEDCKSLSMQATCEWLNIKTENLHNSVYDVIIGSNILIKFLRLIRSIAPKVKWDGSEINKIISGIKL